MLFTVSLLVFFIILIGYLYVLVSTVFGLWRTGVPFVRSSQLDIHTIFNFVALEDGQTVMDLGSGNGSVLFAVEAHARVRGIGYELTGWAYYWANFLKRIRKSELMFYKKDFFTVPWNSVDVFYCYLYPTIMEKVEKKFREEGRPGSILVSRDFPLPTIRPAHTIALSGSHQAYVYQR